ncbi:hypothetical protein GALMADRAFT_143320 [Galerina marginata CBS 339.88]|uniref:Uncharacterized protein n=1 Tax=Galerina marginata (strain CBS 339.88) TaxID=685588 RepID=A0A067SM31_GALM3|nr:hypothetical protein GALMADRAFT_143320 [Galerina marginata CBS 339.88]
MTKHRVSEWQTANTPLINIVLCDLQGYACVNSTFETIRVLQSRPPFEANHNSFANLQERTHTPTLARPPPHDPPSTKQFSTDKQPLLDTPEMERQLPPPHSGLNWKLASKLGFALIPAVSYVGFCFIVHHRTVLIGGSGLLGLPLVHFSTESGITTVAILIVYVALWPVNSVLDEIRSEEFFRFLRAHPNGVPLDKVNAVSAPTNGAFDIFLATIHRHCSPYLTYTLAIALVITATSSLAPAALNAKLIWVDVDDPNFQIGAITNNTYTTRKLYPEAATMSWVESTLNLTKTYYKVTVAGSEGDPSGYIVPFPPGYPTTMRAYWTTDIVVFNPSCSWKTPNMTGVIDVSTGNGWTLIQGQNWPVALLPETNSYIGLTSNAFVPTPESPAKISVAIPFLELNNPARSILDGSVVFVISQFPGQHSNDSIVPASNFTDMSALPTLQFSNGNVLAFLRCFPHASIQTRQVRTTGNGILTLGRTQQQRQGNLDIDQVNAFLGLVMSDFPTSSGPFFDEDGGAAMMVKLMYGDNFTKFRNIPPAPLANITAVYKLVIQSAMKTLVSGALGTAIVPGGLGEMQLAFSSSLGHVITSAIFFAILMIALVAAQYRVGRDAFTLIHVAAALEGSDVPTECRRQLSGEANGEMVQLVHNKEGGRIVLIKSKKDEQKVGSTGSQV